MKLLLTSAGITTDAIRAALVDLLGKPVGEADALCIPTAQWGHPMTGPDGVWRFVAGRSRLPMTDLGWRSLGVLELTALPSIGRERWEPWVRAADVLLVSGGDAAYLAHWMRESGLADLLPSLPETVWVGLSAGSMVLTPRIGDDFVAWPAAPHDRALGVVDFAIFPHLDEVPENSLAEAQRWAGELGLPAYALDDRSALVVVDDRVEVVSEGRWTAFGGAAGCSSGSARSGGDAVQG